MINNPENIHLEAKRGFLQYIDGYFAQIISQNPTTDQNGGDAWSFELYPSPELIKKYRLKPANIYKEYPMIYSQIIPADFIIQQNADPSNTRWLYLRNFEHREIAATRFLLGITQQKQIEFLKKQINEERAKAESAIEKYNLIQQDIPKYLKQFVMPVIDGLAPLAEKMIEKNVPK